MARGVVEAIALLVAEGAPGLREAGGGALLALHLPTALLASKAVVSRPFRAREAAQVRLIHQGSTFRIVVSILAHGPRLLACDLSCI